jgi:phage replication O-like protein O
MANPQLENGYTSIANDIMDALCRIRIPGEEMQILNAILRKTYGWGKKFDCISLSQFQEITSMNKPHIIQAIKGLLLKKVIIVTEKGNEPAKVYGINKDYEQWIPLPKKVTLPKKVIGITEKGNKSLLKTVPTKTNKTTITKTIPPISPAEYPDWVPVETFSEYQSSRKKKLKPSVLPRFFDHLKKLADSSRASPEEILNQSIVNGWEGVFELKQGGNGNGISNGSGSFGGTGKAFEKTGGARSDDQPYPVDVVCTE